MSRVTEWLEELRCKNRGDLLKAQPRRLVEYGSRFPACVSETH